MDTETPTGFVRLTDPAHHARHFPIDQIDYLLPEARQVTGGCRVYMRDGRHAEVLESVDEVGAAVVAAKGVAPRVATPGRPAPLTLRPSAADPHDAIAAINWLLDAVGGPYAGDVTGPYIPRDGTAMLHAGESVLPARSRSRYDDGKTALDERRAESMATLIDERIAQGHAAIDLAGWNGRVEDQREQLRRRLTGGDSASKALSSLGVLAYQALESELAEKRTRLEAIVRGDPEVLAAAVAELRKARGGA
jgi:hypothetical protein